MSTETKSQTFYTFTPGSDSPDQMTVRMSAPAALLLIERLARETRHLDDSDSPTPVEVVLSGNLAWVDSIEDVA